MKKGFTLIELAIGLVIIGVIISIVIKGQDLIKNFQYKKGYIQLKNWINTYYIFLDRYGRYVGDIDSSGVIGDSNVDNVKADIINMSLSRPPYEIIGGNPSNTLTVGSLRFYVFFGYDKYFGTRSDTGIRRHILVLCKNLRCDEIFSDKDKAFLSYLDKEIDNISDGRQGLARASSTRGYRRYRQKWIMNTRTRLRYRPYSSPSVRMFIYYFEGFPF